MNQPDHPNEPGREAAPDAKPNPDASLLAKLGVIAVVSVVLLGGLMAVRSVLLRRWELRNEAIANITSTWGKDQSIVGPVLVLPVRVPRGPLALGGASSVRRAFFLPADLTITGDVKTTQLHRGIFRAVVYRAAIEFRGEFAPPDLASLQVDPQDVLWDQAMVVWSIPDLRSIDSAVELEWGGEKHPMQAGCPLPGFASGLHARVAVPPQGESGLSFRMTVGINGSGRLDFVPLGASQTVQVTSAWPHPSFDGAFLPAEREVTGDGFRALWRLSSYSRALPQAWVEGPDGASSPDLKSLSEIAFGVRFWPGIDAYRNCERAAKYGILFIVLVFAVFFLLDLMDGAGVHPLQYAMVGAALVLFYLGLLSLSEVMSFGWAYLLSTAATMTLICWYSAGVLKSGTGATLIGLLLAAIYGFLYMTLQLEDYALLAGTIGLFAFLALLMAATRKLEPGDLA